MKPPRLRWFALAAMCLPCVVAQDRAGKGQTTNGDGVPTLHQAWLREILDLDVAGAAADYARIAERGGPGAPERWVAAARLLELRRLQAIDTAPSIQDCPTPLRATFQAASVTIPLDPILARVRQKPAEALRDLTSETGRLPRLRPAVPAVESWLMDQIGPSLRDRMRQRMETFASRNRSADVRRYTERLYATDIARAELGNRPAQANALRALYFRDWKPPEAPGDPLPHVARIRTNLDAWLADGDTGAQQAAALRDLGTAIQRLAETDPAAALALVRRLPFYAERLLAPAASGPGGEPSRR